MEPTELNQDNLTVIMEHIPGPTYDRKAMVSGIVHIGVGGFHRSHQAFYTHQLLEKEHAYEWGICGVGLRDADKNIHDVLTRQDGLYTLIVKHPDGKIESGVLGAINDFLLAKNGVHAIIDRMADPNTKIVSLTITEGGYNFNPATGEFDFSNPDIRHELENPNDPKTVYGYLTAALKKRHEAGLMPFSIMSCDNIQHNGDVARKMVLAFANRQDPELGEWIAENVTFPNSMVDRITPVTTKADMEYLEKTHRFKDTWPVTCEPFIQWVVEDDFCNGRPAYEKVGVQFVPDVKPYEKMKLRLLNAGHSVLGILGAIEGKETINDCMKDDTFSTFLRVFMDREATPTLDEVRGIDLDDYKDSLLQRFSNPTIKDSVSRICSESSAKLPKFLIETVQENLAAGRSIDLAVMVIAAWCYYSDKQVDKNGNPLKIIDAMADELHFAAKQTASDPLAFIKLDSIFGDLAQNERFSKRYQEMAVKIYADTDVKNHMRQMF